MGVPNPATPSRTSAKNQAIRFARTCGLPESRESHLLMVSNAPELV
jgi:hypothetical protein